MVALDSYFPMTGVTEQLAQWQKFAPYYFGDGIIATAGLLNEFAPSQHTAPNMSVVIDTGRCFIQGVFGENGVAKTLTITAADATNPRIDRVVLRVDTVAQDMELVVLTGIAAVSPSAPALIRSATQTDYSVCQVLVGTTVTSIVTANITDERTFAGPRGIPQRATTVASSGTIQPYGPNLLTEEHLWCKISGSTTISNVAIGNLPPASGALLVLEFLSAGCQVASGGNISVVRNYISGGTVAMLTLMWDATQWVELGRSGEQAPSHQYYGNPTGTVAAATFAGLTTTDFVASVFWATYAPTTTQSNTPGTTNTCYRVCTLGKLVILEYNVQFTSGGTANNAIVVTLPTSLQVAATIFLAQCVGSGMYKIATTPVYYPLSVIVNSVTSLCFVASGSIGGAQQGFLGTTAGGSVTIANNDILTFVAHYETA